MNFFYFLVAWVAFVFAVVWGSGHSWLVFPAIGVVVVALIFLKEENY